MEHVRPLEGLLVVDLAWGLPSLATGLLLADYGADVVKVERGTGAPDGPELRSVFDRGKSSIVLDPCHPGTPDVVDQLLSKADVVLTVPGSGWPGCALSPDEVRARHPHLVQCLITGYGIDGPWSDRPGYDALVCARVGLMAEQLGHRPGPVYLGHPSVAYTTGFLATIGILAAVHARGGTGAGQLVDTSLLDGALAVSAINWWWNERDISHLARDGDVKGFGRNRLITDLFRCGDGEYLMMHTGGEGAFKRATDLLGLSKWIRPVVGLEMSTPLDDDELHAARVLVPEAFLARPRAEWLQDFEAADVAALPVLRPEQVFEDPQVVHGGVVVDVDDAVVGRRRQVGRVLRFADAPAPPRPAPRPGADADRLAELLDRPPLQVQDPSRPAAGAPLAGVRVLDISAFLATGFGARLLCDLGADVIKLEPPGGDQMRPLADLFELAQRGKRNVAVDLRTPAGAEILRALVGSADVLMHNLRPGKASALGLDLDQVRAVNPSLIYCHLPGFGVDGPRSHLKSFAPLVSGLTGMLYTAAGRGNPPVPRALGSEDLYNGFNGAIAVLMALRHRSRTGEALFIESPHLSSSLFVRSEQTVDPDGRLVTPIGLDADQTGVGPLYGNYRTADGWISIACVGEGTFSRLVDALECSDLASDHRFASPSARSANAEALAGELRECFRGAGSATWFERLDGAGVPCEVPAPDPQVPELLWDEWMLATGRVYEHRHPEHGWIREVGQCYRLSATPARNNGTSARLGQHTAEVLTELGYGDEAIERLVGEGVCRQTR